MCHKHEMMEHFYSKAGRSHGSLNPAGRATHNIPAEILPPDDVVIDHDDAILDESRVPNILDKVFIQYRPIR